MPKTWGEWALENFEVSAAQVRIEAERFRDYWAAKSGNNATKLDWEATWRNWCRKAGWRRRLTAAESGPLYSAASDDVIFADNKLELINDKRAEWLSKFGSEEYLNVALLEAAGAVQLNSTVPLIAQVERQLSRILRWRMDDDRRDQERTKAMAARSGSSSPKSAEEALEETRRRLRMISEG